MPSGTDCWLGNFHSNSLLCHCGILRDDLSWASTLEKPLHKISHGDGAMGGGGRDITEYVQVKNDLGLKSGNLEVERQTHIKVARKCNDKNTSPSSTNELMESASKDVVKREPSYMCTAGGNADRCT